MRLAGRIAAAIEVLQDISGRHRPASEALRDWGKAHRFAGSGDRHAIGTLVYDALRQRNSAAFRAGGDTPRALVLGILAGPWGMALDALDETLTEQHGPGALTAGERQSLARALPADVPAHVAGDFPEWMTPYFTRVFGAEAAAEGAALARRAPVDLRVNTLKATRADVLQALTPFGAVEAPLSPLGVRIAAPGPEQKHVNVEAEPAHGKGWFEVQDSASQVAALLSGVLPGQSVADICAGAGGKTLALSAMMQNQGRLIAHDKDRFRLRPIFERLTRAGAGNVEVLGAGGEAALAAVGGFDCVLIDAPCTGTGAWRRKPDSKWKLTQKTLDQRLKDQREVLQRGASLVKPGGTLVYITCSVLKEENTGQVQTFLSGQPAFVLVPIAQQWQATIGGAAPPSADGAENTLTLSPRQHDVDGFFVSVMKRVR